MQDATPYREEAMRLSEEEFCRRYPAWYLLKEPSTGAGAPSRRRATRFRTRQLDRNALQPDDAAVRELGDWGPKCMVGALVPIDRTRDEVIVGRTDDCDVTIPLPFISGRHAQFLFNDDGTLDVVDHSSNGIVMHGLPLTKGARHPVELGDRLSLGVLDLRVVDGSLLYRFLRGDTRGWG